MKIILQDWMSVENSL